ncbi:tumor necrosis factor ligand superfamily member 9 [Pseudophryne corroboree]|uniref:tumor necrosis factor ligand superfamily member 9 n=1 Tax=Pseudophryne corroboree TaxID=495146 RepID=UPI0030819879
MSLIIILVMEKRNPEKQNVWLVSALREKKKIPHKTVIAAIESRSGKPTKNLCNPTKNLCNPTKNLCNPTQNLCNPTKNLCNPTKNLCNPTQKNLCNPTKNLCNPTQNLCNPTKNLCNPTQNLCNPTKNLCNPIKNLCNLAGPALISSATMTTMSTPVRSEDPENPGATQRRCRCLDYCLVFSLVLLTIVVGSLCVLYLAWERPLVEYSARAIKRGAQQKSSSHLLMDTVVLENNTTVEWTQNNMDDTFLGNDFSYENNELVVGRAGVYYVYSQMALICRGHCQEERTVSLSVLKNTEEKPVLELNIQTKESSMRIPPSSFTAGSKNLRAGDRIRARLWVSHNITDWQIDQHNSFLGLFWISDHPSQES